MALATGHPFVRSPGVGLSRFSHDNKEEAFVHVFSEFPEMLMSKLNAQRQASSLCDVTITTKDGRSYRAHKAVLSACSHYLESELASLGEGKLDGKSEAVIHLGMISSQSFETLLNLLYTSKLMLTNDNVAQVLSAAEALDLDQVSAVCRQFLRSHITSKSVTRQAKPSDSLDVFQDENNNVVREHECYKRGSSEDSTASSSGVSSLGADSSEKEPEKMGQHVSQHNEEIHIPTPLRPMSLPDMPADRDSPDVERPSSAPLSSVKQGKKEHESQKAPSPHQQNTPSPIELVDVTSTEWLSNTTSSERTPEGTLHTATLHPLYAVKSEVSTLSEYYSKTEFSNSTVTDNITNYSDSPTKADLNSSGNDKYFGQHPRNIQRSQSLAEPPIAPVPCHSLPLGHRRSYDSVFTNQPCYVDLNTTPIPGRKKAKSVDHSSAGLPYARTVSGVFQDQGSLRHPTSLWASLYMLRSQALTSAAGILGTSTSGARPSDPYSTMPDFSRKQVQHSKPLIPSSSIICKLCRLEFTSEWALSMHYHLCHPMSYFYRPSETSPVGHRQQEQNKESDQSGPVDFTMRTLPCMSASGGTLVQNPSETESDNKMLRLINVPTESKTMHKCYHCKKEFDSIFLLRKHKSMEHVKRPYRCHQCDSAFPNKAGLSVHLRSHTGERPYRCKICNKAFTQLGHVQRHQKVHTGEKPYQCPLCQARVRDKASMHYHILAHQGVKPFQCDQCDARFTKRSSLVKHKNVHTGSFLYQCPQCKASFREKASLSRHVRSQHKDPCFTVTSDHVSMKSNQNMPSNLSPDDCSTPLDPHVSSSTDEIQVV